MFAVLCVGSFILSYVHMLYYLLLYIFRQESLVMEATGDSLAGEQTWPSEHEMCHDDAAHVGDGSGIDDGTGRSRRKIPVKVRSQSHVSVIVLVPLDIYVISVI